jgi:non-specific serine/threonine protein kinase/serine/threonine-protein kinase
MKPERWRQVEALYHAALEREPGERVAFLAEACAGDETLRREVDSLLGFDGRAEGFIEAPALEVAARLFAPDDERFERNKPQDLPLTVERIGPYKILCEIGRGGMGTVFLAERDDDEYHKQVAIKLIKRGMDSDAILTRFRTERQILARLEHPNIARLLDGGTTSDGLPYFVMEYIEGLPIDDYADERKLTVTERLKLFLQVCSAVQHSHQHLIVHRDIKPSNILVTADGTTKLLDFGIAKIVAPDSGVAETMSAKGWMTPEYSSPEQLRSEAITTVSDVYSLGVVLYELLAGRSPYRFEYRQPHEIAEVILNSDPDRPSTAAVGAAPVTMRKAAATVPSPEAISEAREGTPEKLRRRLSGDLDNIVLKAMHREKDLRYSSVAYLAEDIRRHLEGLPVLARKDTLSYRALKFIGRNRVAVTAGALLLLTLLGGILATAWQSHQARIQRNFAIAAQKKAERRFNEVRKLAHSVLFDYHNAIEDLPGSTPVRERLVQDATEYLNSLAEEGAGDTSLQVELADAYEKISSVQGGMSYSNLGNTAGAIESLRKCLKIREALVAATPNDAELVAKMAITYRNLAALLSETGDPTGALDSYRNAVKMLETLAAKEPANKSYQYNLATKLGDLGSFLIEQGDWHKAAESQRRAVKIYESLLADDPQNRDYRRSLAVCHEFLGQALLGINDATGAEENTRQAILLLGRLTEEEPRNAEYRRILATCYYYQGDILAAQNKTAQALESYSKGATIVEQLSAADAKNVTFRLDVAFARQRVGDMLAELGRKGEATAHYRQSLAMREAVAKADPTNVWKRWVFIEGNATLAAAVAETGNYAVALEHSRKVIALVEASDAQLETADLRNARARAYERVARVYAVIAADKKTSVRERQSYWQMARHLYQNCLDIWLDMKSQGTFSATEATSFEGVKQAIEECDAHLAK